MIKLLDFWKNLNGYRWIFGLIAAVIGSWYDLKSSVKDVATKQQAYQERQAVKEQAQNFRDDTQDKAIDGLQNDIKEELRELRKDIRRQNNDRR